MSQPVNSEGLPPFDQYKEDLNSPKSKSEWAGEFPVGEDTLIGSVFMSDSSTPNFMPQEMESMWRDINQVLGYQKKHIRVGTLRMGTLPDNGGTLYEFWGEVLNDPSN